MLLSARSAPAGCRLSGGGDGVALVIETSVAGRAAKAGGGCLSGVAGIVKNHVAAWQQQRDQHRQQQPQHRQSSSSSSTCQHSS